MALRARPPADEAPRLKLFMYGEPGVGKTMAAIQFPKAYIIDAEHGTDHYSELIRANGGAVFRTTSHTEVMDQLRALFSERHDYHTLVIDPLTTIYAGLLDESEEKVGTDHGRHYGEAQKHMKRLSNLITALDMNVVVTSHAKPDYGPGMTKIGNTFDGWRRLPYLFDVVVQLVRSGSKRMAKVEKTRVKNFVDGETFAWSYDAVKERYPLESLERTAKAVALADPAQVDRVRRLLGQLTQERIDALKVDAWFSKAGVSDWEDMSAELIEKCIVRLESEVLGVAA